MRKPVPKRSSKGRFAVGMLTNKEDKESNKIEFLDDGGLRKKGLSAIGSIRATSSHPKTVFAIDESSISSSSQTRKKGPDSDTSASVKDIAVLPSTSPIGTSADLGKDITTQSALNSILFSLG